MANDYDLFVIGAGSGGVRAGRIAAGYGARVAVAEESRVGGTCVIRGCIPKKLLTYAAHFADDFEDAEGYGWTVGERSFDWARLIAAKDREIDRLNGLYIKGLEGAGARLIPHRAVLKDAHTIEVGGETLRAETILVATGGRPEKPPIPGIEHAITSDEAFHLATLPKRAIVVGGGYIAVEFAGIFHGLGAETTLVHRGEKVLRGFDEDIRDALVAAQAARGIDQRFGRVVSRIEKTGGGLAVTLDDGAVIACDQILFATGRRPNTRHLGLEAAGVAVNDKGAITVDRYSRTNVPNIYAVGDVTDRVALTPVAIREGHAFADTVFGQRPVAVDHLDVATAVFSAPPIGTVGMSEQAARARYGAVDIYKATFNPLKNTLSGRQERTLMKLVVEPRSDRVLGAHMLGPDSAEIIQGVAIALKMGATKAQLDATMAIHPTAAEEFVTMRTKWAPPAAKAAE
jgi:glutathione reductase (NADPH)